MSTSDAAVLLVLAVGVFLAPPITARLRLPSAVGELVYGAVAAALFSGLRHPPAFVSFAQNFGFLLVLFLAGLELDLRGLTAGGAGRLLRAAPFAFAVPIGSSVIAALSGQPPVLGLLVGTVSIGLTARVLTDLGLLRSRLGQVAIVTGGMGEVVTIVCLTVLGQSAHGSGAVALLLTMLRLAGLFAGGLLLLLLLRDLAWWQPLWFRRLLHPDDPSQLGLRAAMALLSAFAALAVLLQVPPVLAAFVAGLALGSIFPVTADGGVAPSAPLRGGLAAVGLGFFVPIAFITVGGHLDPAELARPGPLALGIAITVASGLVRLLALPLVRRQADWWGSVLVVLVLSEPLTLKVTVAELSVSLHALPASTLTPAVAASTVGAVIFPTLFRLALRRKPVQHQPAASARTVEAA